jgi:uncharacterized YkwD family protein
MKKIKPLFFLVLMVSLMITACQPKEPVKGVESSVNETGDVKAVKITANNCNVTQGCDANSKVLETTNKNATLNVLNKVNNDWYAVQLANNQIGFVPQQQCTPVVPNQQQNVTAKTPTPTTDVPNKGTEPDTHKSKTAYPRTTAPETDSAANNKDKATDTDKTVADRYRNEDKDKDTTTTTNQGISSSEQEMLNLVNAARKQNGLSPLKSDNQLIDVARMKSKDMIDKNYFSHNSPTYGSPFDMLKSFGISYLKAGENIAGNQTVQKAHDALMNSPGHRKNILSPDYTHVGIGIQEGGNYGNMFTQIFVKK